MGYHDVLAFPVSGRFDYFRLAVHGDEGLHPYDELAGRKLTIDGSDPLSLLERLPKLVCLDGLKSEPAIYDCVEFVIKHGVDERLRTLVTPGFQQDPILFIESLGYVNINAPKETDVAMYFHESDCPTMLHFGIWHNDQVVSKWGFGPVFLHPVNLVPKRYGDCVAFFRRD